MKPLKNFLNIFCKNIKKDQKNQLKEVSLFLIVLVYCITILKKTSLKRTGSSYIDFPEWLKNKKATINPKINDDNCFQYALTVTLNDQNIKKKPSKNIKN